MAAMPTPDGLRWLPPSVAAAVVRCELKARTRKSGFLAGRHRSVRKGSSMEFAEYRAYHAGDDLRNLDWKALARKDKLYVREYEEETNLRATLLLDASGSMAYADASGEGRTKLDHARYIAAGLAHVLCSQQDAVGLVTFDTKIRDFLPPKASASSRARILEALERIKPGGESDPAPVIQEIAERLPPRGLIVVLSDMFTEDTGALMRALYAAEGRRHEIAVCHVLAHDELTFPFSGAYELEDMESPRSVQLDARAVRAEYLDQMGAFLREVKDGVHRLRGVYAELDVSEPYEKAIVKVLTCNS